MPISPEQKMDLLVSLCKRRGIVFPDSEIYGGFANAWDYGPYGTELKNNIRDAWWQKFVKSRDDMVGVDTPIIMHPKVWEVSGHIQNFTDPLVDCKKCKRRFRADHLLESKAAEPGYDKEKPVDLKSIKCPECGGELTDIRQFNCMFKTFIGVTEDATSVAYLRPETAGGMFVSWKNIRDTMRRKLPFGIAQIGKAFRNEITPGNFIFRTREFEQMEIEYFCRKEDAPRLFENWLDEQRKWNTEVLGLSLSNLKEYEHPDAERSFYSARTVDFEYAFPFGTKELTGLANRTDYDLGRHQEGSKEDLRYLDPETGEKFIPYVIEPTFGLNRALLAVLSEHFDIDEADTAEEGEKEPRMVLRLPARLAPVKAAVFPLQKKNGLPEIAKDLVKALRGLGFMVEYDESGSIGKRYRRQDEIGTPWCITIDVESIEDKKATIRDRDAMTQERVTINDIPSWISSRLAKQ